MSDIFCTYGGDRDEAIVAHLYDDGSTPERAAFETHVAVCEACREELEGLRAVRGQLAGWAPALLARPLAGPGPGAAAPDDGPHAAFARTPPAGAPRSSWRDVPVWAQAVAAVLVLGVAAGAANLEIRYDQNGFTVRTGWMTPRAAGVAAGEPAAPAQTPPWQADLAKVEDELRADMRAAQPRTVAVDAHPSADAETLKRVRALVEESETRQQNELALRIAQVVRDVQAQRAADLTRIDRTLGVIQNNTGFEVARQREMLQTLAVRVSQTR